MECWCSNTLAVIQSRFFMSNSNLIFWLSFYYYHIFVCVIDDIIVGYLTSHHKLFQNKYRSVQYVDHSIRVQCKRKIIQFSFHQISVQISSFISRQSVSTILGPGSMTIIIHDVRDHQYSTILYWFANEPPNRYCLSMFPTYSFRFGRRNVCCSCRRAHCVRRLGPEILGRLLETRQTAVQVRHPVQRSVPRRYRRNGAVLRVMRRRRIIYNKFYMIMV